MINEEIGCGMDLDAYLARLGFSQKPLPSLENLFALHRAHVERVPYENLDIFRRIPTSILPIESARQVIQGRGGHCIQLNSAFWLLLTRLGYTVEMRRGATTKMPLLTTQGAQGDHLALTVTGLPGQECPTGDWYVDVGSGDSIYEPLPLQSGSFKQGPFTYRLIPSEISPGDWHLINDPTGSFSNLHIANTPVDIDAFHEVHYRLSTSPTSHHLRTATAQRRHASGFDYLRGCVLTYCTESGKNERSIESGKEWYEVLTDIFLLNLSGLSATSRVMLWNRVWDRHTSWIESRASDVVIAA